MNNRCPPFIFLDIDGPILPTKWRKELKEKGLSTAPQNIIFNSDILYKLKRIVNATNAKIILSSTWRFGYDPKNNVELSPLHVNLIGSFAANGLSIHDCTPIRHDRHRGKEIMQWIEEYCEDHNLSPSDICYVVIDDSGFDIEDTIPPGKFLKVDGNEGLSYYGSEWCIKSLNNQMKRMDI